MSSLGTLEIFSPEIREHITLFLNPEFGEWRVYRTVSREFTSWMPRVRILEKSLVRSPLLRETSSVREIDGRILVADIDDLRRTSQILRGDATFWFPAAVQGEKKGSMFREPCLVEEIHRGLQLLDLTIFCLLEAQDRIQRFPSSELWIKISRLLEIRWKNSECILHIPVSTVSCYSEYRERLDDPIPNALQGAVRSFLSIVPLVHLSLLQLVMDEKTGFLLGCRNVEFQKFAFGPGNPLTSLRSLGDFFDVRALRLPSVVLCLPSITELRFSTFEGRRETPRPLRPMFANLGTCLRDADSYTEIATQLQEINSGYLVPAPNSKFLLDLPARYPNVRRWKIVLDLTDFKAANVEEDLVPFFASTAQELESAISDLRCDNPDNIICFREFWDRWHGERDLELFFLSPKD